MRARHERGDRLDLGEQHHADRHVGLGLLSGGSGAPVERLLDAGPGDADAVLHVHVQPRSGRTEIAGRHGDALKVRVQAPAVEGRATEAARGVIAAAFGVSTSRVVLVTGERSRVKRFRVTGVTRAGALTRLAALLDAAGA